MQDKHLHTDDKFTDRAWGEMKKLLDQELPVAEEKKRRPFIFWITGAAAIAALLSGIYFFTDLTQKNPESVIKKEWPLAQKEVQKKSPIFNENPLLSPNIKEQYKAQTKKENTVNNVSLETENIHKKIDTDKKHNIGTIAEITSKQNNALNHLTATAIPNYVKETKLPDPNRSVNSGPVSGDIFQKEHIGIIDEIINGEKIISKRVLMDNIETLRIPNLIYNTKINPVFLTENKQMDARNTVFASTLFVPGSKTNGLNVGYFRKITTKKQGLEIELGAGYNYIAQPIEFTFSETSVQGGTTGTPSTSDVLLSDISYAGITNSRILDSNGLYEEFDPANSSNLSLNRLKLHYLSLPIRVNYKKGKFEITSGIQAGILMLASNRTLNGGFLKIFDPNDDEAYFINPDTSSVVDKNTAIPSIANLDLSATWGLGYQLTKNVGLHIDYIFGFKDVIKHNNNKDYNRFLQLSMQYSW